MKTARGMALAVLFLLGLMLAVPAVWAADQGGKVFQDLKPGHWAEKAVAEMKAKGVIAGTGSGNFEPEKGVTREEAIVFLVRTLGLEPAEALKLPAGFSAASEVDNWAIPAAAVALNQGIIAGADEQQFRPRDTAKRYEIAVFVTRALGLAGRAESSADDSLPYADAAEIPAGARGYVVVAGEQGIMTGSGGKFAPLDPVTRAEMAVLLERVDNKLGELAGKTIKGQVSAISAVASTIMLKSADNKVLSLPVLPNLPAYRGGKVINWLTDLEYDEPVMVVQDSSGKVAYLETIAEDQLNLSETEVAGEVTAVDPAAGTFSIGEGSQKVTYTTGAQTEFVVDGLPGSISDLKASQQVSMRVLGHSAIKVTATSPVTSQTGEIVSLPAAGGNQITIDVDGGETVFYLLPDTTISLDGDEVAISDLMPGQSVSLSTRGRTISALYARRLEWTKEGTVKKATFLPLPTIVIEDSEGVELSYTVQSDAPVWRNGKRLTLRDLVAGDKVELGMENRLVKRIDATVVKRSSVGTVQTISRSLDGESFVLIDAEGQLETFTLSPDAVIQQGTEKMEFSQLMVGDRVEVSLESDMVVEVDVRPRLVKDFLVGEINSLVTAAKVIIVDDMLAEGQERQVNITDGTRIYSNTSTRSFSYLKTGDQVIVTGHWEANTVFMADVVVILNN